MPLPIEHYALIGNTRTAALVGRDGSIDWLCAPRFDAPACFAALLGGPEHGHWRLAPRSELRDTRRAYRAGTLVLETDFETCDGAVRVIDCMPLWPDRCDVVRVVQGLRGRLPMRMDLAIRFDYGKTIPWVQRLENGLAAIAGSNALELRTIVELRGEDFTTVADFVIHEGQMLPFVLSYFASHQAPPLPIDGFAAVDATTRWWRDWCQHSRYQGRWKPMVERSLITLKALIYAPTGGIVAAPTTSLPEQEGGVRNWDYRYCWLRDATFTLYALLIAGYQQEAQAWREWLLRAAAGRPEDLQILYDVAGGRWLKEGELDHLPGYQGAHPVRIGNAAADQLQLDVYGEVMDALHVARGSGLAPNEQAWELQRVLLDFLESHWDQPDNGIWEMRGPRRHFTHSKVMAWVALDRAVKAVERFGLHGSVDQWRSLRAAIHQQVCARGFDAERNTFVQAYDARELDANLLMIPLVGFLPPTDARVGGTVAAIERELLEEGLVRRYRSSPSLDGLPQGEGLFLPCSFWLADNYALLGRPADAGRLFERLLALGNDVGLFAEEYDLPSRRLLGNFPQAFTHVALINTARNLSHAGGPSEHRGDGDEQQVTATL
jgi:GH15 family glucan-1,4-alpha-glucosidase